MFMREHADGGRISAEQAAAYLHLSTVLHSAVPAPDILVLLNPDPEVSIKRLREAEEKGERPREFPDEASKEGWVRRWHTMYEELHRQFEDRFKQDPVTRLVKLDASAVSETNARTVLNAVLECSAQQRGELSRTGRA
jgi:thymidylate kinase